VKKNNKAKVPAKQSNKIAKSSNKTDIPKKQKGIKFSVKEKDGDLNPSFLINGEDGDLELSRASGCKNLEAAVAVIKNGMNPLIAGSESPTTVELAGNDYLSMMSELKPRDGFEGMLISQMILVYTQAMKALASARNNSGSLSISEQFQNQSIKLMRLYNQQLETLDKHRNKGRQKMTVEHVHVHPGGQAIVGEIHQGEGGVKNEK